MYMYVHWQCALTSNGKIVKPLSFVPITRPSLSRAILVEEPPFKHLAASSWDCTASLQPASPQSQKDRPYPRNFVSCPAWQTAMQPIFGVGTLFQPWSPITSPYLNGRYLRSSPYAHLRHRKCGKHILLDVWDLIYLQKCWVVLQKCHSTSFPAR